MAVALSAAAQAMLDSPLIVHLATIGPRGEPRVTPVWVAREGDELLVDTTEGTVKAQGLAPGAHVALSLVDAEDPYRRALVLGGEVVSLSRDGADALIDALSAKYLGVTPYPWRQPGEVWLTARIRVTRVRMAPEG
jgi:PPOX class probable F420-dependent enzyme